MIDMEKYAADYWKQRALAAEEVGRVLTSKIDTSSEELGMIIAKHINGSVNLQCNAYKGTLGFIHDILSKMITDKSLNFDSVNTIVTNIRLLQANMDKLSAEGLPQENQS